MTEPEDKQSCAWVEESIHGENHSLSRAMSKFREPPACLQSRWTGAVSHGTFQGPFLAHTVAVKGILAGVISCLTNAAGPDLTGLEMSSALV